MDNNVTSFELRVELIGVSQPKIWRKFLLPLRITFFELHEMICTGFDLFDVPFWHFTDSRSERETIDLGFLDHFSTGIFGALFEDRKDAESTMVLPVLLKNKKYKYCYTYDTGWEFLLSGVKLRKDPAPVWPQLLSYKGEYLKGNIAGTAGIAEAREILAEGKGERYDAFRKENPLYGEPVYPEVINQLMKDILLSARTGILQPDEIYDVETYG